MPVRRARVDAANWSRATSRDSLELIVAGLVEQGGVRAATIGVVSGAEVVTVAATGEGAALSFRDGRRTPLGRMVAALGSPERLGRYHLVRHGPSAPRQRGGAPATGDPETGAGRRELLLAPLRGEDGDLIGLLGVDVCLDGVDGPPLPADRARLLDRHAVQAERALRILLERDAAAERARIAETAREVVRGAAFSGGLEPALRAGQATILRGFGADRVVVRVYATPEAPEVGLERLDLDDDQLAAVRAQAEQCWAEQRGATLTGVDDGSDPDRALVAAAVEASGLGVAVLVPIGVQQQCLGHFIVGRADPRHQFDAHELTMVLEIGRDLGQAVANARMLAHEQRVVHELQRVAAYRERLLSTVSHELRNPLSVVRGHLELLESEDLPEQVATAVATMGRATGRMIHLVESLLMLAALDSVAEPTLLAGVPVAPAVGEAVDLAQVTAAAAGVEIEVAADSVASVRCGRDDLTTVLGNLLGNAVKYSRTGGTVRVSVEESGSEAAIVVADDGIGIAEGDRARLGSEFFRSTNPQAVLRPGTGLGLTICERILTRCGGRLDVESELGVGSTFRAVLPLG